MPPPKKPKNGPTTVEQFLSREELELQRMEEAPSRVAPSSSSSSPSCSTTSPHAETSEKGGSGAREVEVKEEEDTSVPVSSASSSSSASVSGFKSESSATASAVSGGVTSGSSRGPTLDSSPDFAGTRFRLLRQLFVQQEPLDPDSQALPPPASSLPAAQPRTSWPKGRGDDGRAAMDSGRGAGCQDAWPLERSCLSGGTVTSGAAPPLPRATSSFQPVRSSLARAGGSSSTSRGVDTTLSSKNLKERTYLTSLIKDSPLLSPGSSSSSSGAMAAASYLERAALNSGKLLHGVKKGASSAAAAPKYIHAAFQLPLMDTSTSGQAVTGPLSTSMFAYLAAQGAHPHPHPHPPPSPLPSHLPSLPRCCGPASLPLVDTSSSSALTSFSSSSSSPSSLLSSSSFLLASSLASSGGGGGCSSSSSTSSAAAPQPRPQQVNEPYDLSVKKLCGLDGSQDSDSTGSTDKTSGDLNSSSSRPGSGTGEASTGTLPLPSPAPHNGATSSSATSVAGAAAVSRRPSGGERDSGGCPSPGALPRGVAAHAHYLMDMRAAEGLLHPASSPLSRLAQDMAGAVLGSMTHRTFPGRTPLHLPSSATSDTTLTPSREPSDSKAGGGDISQAHSRLASGATPGLSGASPGGGGAGPGPGPGPGGVGGGVLGMHSHSIMSASGHLQAPTSTTPESSGLGVGPSFFPMEPPLSVNDIKQEIPAGSSTPAKVCQVCNDNASGFHYGVWSCEGCKAFFKRSIQGPVDYMCPATNNCTIDKHRRKSCQACRLRKCYEVGMNKGSQRKDRRTSGGSSTPKGKRCRADSTDAVNSTSGAGASKSVKRSQSAPILEALQKADLPVLESYHNHDQPLDRVHLLNTLIKLADRELVYLINWAKHVPGYTDLSLSDQVHLIECCWMELLLLNCAFRSMDYDGRRLVFAPDFHLDRPLWVVMGMTEILEQVSAVAEQMVQYSVTREELLLLKATILVNAEVRRLASFNKIVEMRQMIVDALTEVAQKSHPEDPRRVPSLLLLLTHVRQAGERGIAYFQTLKHGGCVAFCDLLTEMLDAHNSATPAVVTASSSTAGSASMPSTSSTGMDQNSSLASPHLPQGPS